MLWMACLLALILMGLGIAVYEIHVANLIGRLDGELKRRVSLLAVALYAPGPPRDGFGPSTQEGFPDEARHQKPPLRDEPANRDVPLPASTASLFDQDKTVGFYFAFWSRHARVPFKHSANSPTDLARPDPGEHDTGTYVRTRGDDREAFHATELGDCILAGRSLAPELAEARRFAGLLLFGGLSSLVLILAGTWWLIGRALQPVEKISAAASKISSGDLSQRISVAETESELGRLAEVLNATFARLETAFAQQKQFTADASHELRTPLAVLISEAQTSLTRERSPEEYREALAASLEAAQKMRRLTESLLQLARMDAGKEIMRREKTNLADIAGECVKMARPLATARNLQIHCDLAPVETFCDATCIAQVVTNLVANAISYNKDGGEIWIVTRTEKGAAILTVADTGQGIASKDLPRVFERFYRADKSRTGSNTGLGLAICQAIIEAHGGIIEVSSKENVGTTFTVRLPV